MERMEELKAEIEFLRNQYQSLLESLLEEAKEAELPELHTLVN